MDKQRNASILSVAAGGFILQQQLLSTKGYASFLSSCLIFVCRKKLNDVVFVKSKSPSFFPERN